MLLMKEMLMQIRLKIGGLDNTFRSTKTTKNRNSGLAYVRSKSKVMHCWMLC
jgi:hypothetical protein